MKKLFAMLIAVLIAIMPLSVAAEEYVLHAGMSNGAGGNAMDAGDAEKALQGSETENNKEDVTESEDIAEQPSNADAKADELINSESRKLLARCEKMPNPERCKRIVKKRVEWLKKVKSKNRQLVKKAIEKRKERVKEWDELRKDKRFSKFRIVNRFKARKIAVERLKKTRTDYLRAKKRYLELRDELKDYRQRVHSAKRIANECKGVDTEECRKKMEELRENAKTYVLKAADAIIAHLERLKLKIEENEYLTEDEANDMVSRIDSKIAEIEDAKKTIESAETREEIIEAAKTINAAWKKAKIHSIESVAREANARVGGIIIKSKLLEIRLEKVLDRMEENGKDISAVKSLIDEFNMHIEKAKENFESAQSKFEEARKEPDNEKRMTLLQEGHNLVLEARKHLIEANAKVRKIFIELKKQNAQKELSEVTLEDVEMEVSSETEGTEGTTTDTGIGTDNKSNSSGEGGDSQ